MNNETSNTMNSPAIEQTGEVIGKTPASSSKLGLIIGLIVGAVALVGIVVAVVVLANSTKKESAFDLAVQKLLSQEETRNSKVTGSIQIDTPDSSSGISEINLTIDSEVVGASLVNDTKIGAEIKLVGGQSIYPEFEGIYADSGDIFIRPSGLISSISKLTGVSYESLSNEVPLRRLLGDIDNNWLYTTSDEIKGFMSSNDNSIAKIEDKSVQCLSKFATSLTQNAYSLTELYNSHPFITATQDNLTITQKANPLYKVVINKDNLVAFSNDFNNTASVKEFLGCVNASASPVDSNAIDELISVLPEIYTEIDDNHDITRFYTALDAETYGADIVIDLSFSHPNTVNIVEPTEYQKLSETIEKLMQSAFGL